MKLLLRREPSTARSTFGVLFVDNIRECFTLEDVVRPAKIKGQTAIPAGTYEIILNWSLRFQRMLPLLLNVPGFEGVRIHPGNTDADTEGCVLVGVARGRDRLERSRDAFNRLYPKLYQASKKEKIYLEILDPA